MKALLIVASVIVGMILLSAPFGMGDLLRQSFASGGVSLDEGLLALALFTIGAGITGVLAPGWRATAVLTGMALVSVSLVLAGMFTNASYTLLADDPVLMGLSGVVSGVRTYLVYRKQAGPRLPVSADHEGIKKSTFAGS